MATLIKRSLEQHEEIIESGVKSFIDVGRSLMAIRDDKLYPKEFDTFDAYCKKRWGFAKSQAYRLIESSVVVSDLSPIGDTGSKKSGDKLQIVPENEAQARAVAESAPDAKTRATVWKAAVASAPKDESGKPVVTAAVVKKAAESIVGPSKPRQPGDEPTAPQHRSPPKEGNGKLDFDDDVIDQHYGKLIRAVDARADALSAKGDGHKACIADLRAFAQSWKAWRKESRK